VDPLFWHLMTRPEPLRSSPQWVDRLVERLELLHECYETALTELGFRAATPSPSCGSPAVVPALP
jgi:hypothetical protein